MTFFSNGAIKIKCGECAKPIGAIERNKLTLLLTETLAVWCIECNLKRIREHMDESRRQAAKAN